MLTDDELRLIHLRVAPFIDETHETLREGERLGITLEFPLAPYLESAGAVVVDWLADRERVRLTTSDVEIKAALSIMTRYLSVRREKIV